LVNALGCRLRCTLVTSSSCSCKQLSLSAKTSRRDVHCTAEMAFIKLNLRSPRSFSRVLLNQKLLLFSLVDKHISIGLRSHLHKLFVCDAVVGLSCGSLHLTEAR
jgi:hypothetical protein